MVIKIRIGFFKVFKIRQVLGISFLEHITAVDIHLQGITGEIIKKIHFIRIKGYLGELLNIRS